MGIINLFFIPMIAVYILYKLKGKELKLSLEFTAVYMIHCSVIAVITKLILFVIKFLFEFNYTDVNSAYYSILAFVISLVIPFLVKRVNVNSKEE